MSLGVPDWLSELLHRAGYDGHYIEMVEIGGRGVKTPMSGWVSVGELVMLAKMREKKND